MDQYGGMGAASLLALGGILMFVPFHFHLSAVWFSDSIAHTNTQRCSLPMRLAELRVSTGNISLITDTNALS